MNNPIVLTEFPKSGGSWIVSMIGDVLGIPKRDIYVQPGFNLFEIKKHPWYKDADNLDFPTRSVIKSHELPDSGLIPFDATYVHLVRDGRDVIVSKWFFEKDFCVKNGISQNFDKDFDSYVEEQAESWAEYIHTWSTKNIQTIYYEEFLSNPVTSLKALVESIMKDVIDIQLVNDAVEKNTKKKFSESMKDVFEHNTFVRKGIAGDWRHYFTSKNIDSFNIRAGEAMALLGYKL